MFSTDFIFRQQENLGDNQKSQAGFRPQFFSYSRPEQFWYVTKYHLYFNTEIGKQACFFLVSENIELEGFFTITNYLLQYTLDLRKILGVAKKFLKSRSFLFQTLQNP